MPKLGFFTSICEQDAVWIPQYLAEIERLQMPFAVHFDRCSAATKVKMLHPLMVGYTMEDDSSHKFSEMDKQHALDVLVEKGFDWAVNVDMDETWEKDARKKFEEIMTWDVDLVDYRWLTLWNDKDHIRIDGPCAGGHRAKMFNIQSPRRFQFYHPTVNGPKLFRNGKWNSEDYVLRKSDLVSLHWGMMTKEIRLDHKQRWDKIYESHVGKNPYGFWDWALDESITVKIMKHDYL